MAESELDLDRLDNLEAQLYVLFHGCDQAGNGRLGRYGLTQLCEKLSCDPTEVATICQLLLGPPPSHPLQDTASVDYFSFKQAFITTLSGTTSVKQELSSETSDEGGTNVEPKLVKGEKRYGRKSRPRRQSRPGSRDRPSSSSTGSLSLSLKRLSSRPDMSDSSSDDGLRGIGGKKGSTGTASKLQRSEELLPPSELGDQSATGQPTASSSGGADLKTPEPMKVEADVHTSSAPSSRGAYGRESADSFFEVKGIPAIGSPGLEISRSEQEHLRGIWAELGVGRNGYLTLPELAKVCEHIGMEDMTDADLMQLFENLDTDSDGHVSFDEFMRGLYRHTPAPGARPSPPRTSSSGRTPFQRQRSSTTPGAGSRTVDLFSVIDPVGTGYAHAEDVIHHWDNWGLTNGDEVLSHLQFDAHGKVSLNELTYVLDQELTSEEQTDAVLQAGIISYQAELRHCKSVIEAVVAERDKLRADLLDANSRVSRLADEGDERYGHIEKTRAKELATLEKRYQDQIKALQAELDIERERTQNQVIKQRRVSDQTMAQLKMEETRLRENAAAYQEEATRLENELLEVQERLGDAERLTTRQQRELDAVADLHRKLLDLESGEWSPNESDFLLLRARLLELRGDNKILTDRVDELTNEVEALRRHGNKGMHRRKGSVLSKYTDVDMKAPSEDTGTDTERSVGDSLEMDTIRPLFAAAVAAAGPRSDGEGTSMDEDGDTPLTVPRLRSIHAHELANVRMAAEREKKDVDQAYRLEISDLESAHASEIDRLKKLLVQDKTKLEEAFNAEKESYERQVLHLKQRHSAELQATRDRYEAECTTTLDSISLETQEKIARLESEHRHELEERMVTVQKELSSCESSRVKELQDQLNAARKEMELLQKDLVTQASAAVSLRTDVDKEVERRLAVAKVNWEEEMVEKYGTEFDTAEASFFKLKADHQHSIPHTAKPQEEQFELKETKEKLEHEISDLRRAQLLSDQQRIKTEELKSANQNLLEKVRQAEEARMTMDKSGSASALQVTALKETIERLTRTQETAGKDLELKCRRIAQLESQLEQRKGEIDMMKSDMNKVEISRDHIEKDRVDGENDKERLVKQISDLKKKMESMDKEKLRIDHDFAEYKIQSQRDMEDIKKRNDRLTATLNKQSQSLESRTSEYQERFEESRSLREERDILRTEKDRLEHGLRTTTVDLERRTVELEKLREEKETLDRSNFTLERQLHDTQQRLQDTAQSTSGVQTELERLLAERADWETKVRTSKDQVGDLEGRLYALVREKDRLSAEAAEKTQQLDLAKKKGQSLEEKGEEAKREIQKYKRSTVKLEDDLVDVKRRLSEKEKDLSDVKSSNDKLLRENKSVLRDLEEREKHIVDLKVTNERLSEAVDEAVRKIGREAQGKEGGGKEVDVLRAENVSLSKSVLHMEQELNDLQQKKDTLERKHAREKDTCEDMERQVRDLTFRLREIEREKEAADKRLRDLTEEIQSNTENTDSVSVELSAKLLLVEQERDKALSELTRAKHDAGSAERDKKALEQFNRNIQENLYAQKKEIESLKRKVHVAETEALEARQNLSAQSGVDRERHNEVLQKFAQSEKKVRQLETALNARSHHSSTLIQESQDDYQRKLRQLEDDLDDAKRKLKQTDTLLKDQQTKWKKQLEKTTNSDLLVKELYVENAQMVRALQVTEERQKRAEERCLALEDRCRSMQKLTARNY